MKQCIAEAVGTFALVFAGTGAIVINGVSGGTVTHVGIALTFGLVVMAMIYAVGDTSGAHLNPAVTLGFWLSRRFAGKSVLPYIVSQLIGAFAASTLLWSMFNETNLGATHAVGPQWHSFVLETVLTAMLMLTILSVATGPKEKGLLAGVAIGGVIAFEAMFAGPISGASMNPARSLAPAALTGALDDIWIYLAGPVLGAAIGVIGHKAIEPKRMRVAFICVENSNRSQMAQAFGRMAGLDAHSAGSQPSGVVNPKAIEAMREVGYDLTAHRSKGLDDLQGEFDLAVTMGCGDQCPALKAKRREDWQIPDPKTLPPDEFRKVRDLIASKVRSLAGPRL